MFFCVEYGSLVLQYGPTVFGLLATIFWLCAAAVKIPHEQHTELEKIMHQLQWQCRWSAIAAIFTAITLLLLTLCHFTGF